jgi:hypothetical protein
MSTEIINLTRQYVCQKVDEIVKYSDSPYQSAYSIPQLQQKLIVRVLNQVQPRYGLASQAANQPALDDPRAFSPEEKQQLEQLIQSNIVQVLQEENVIQHFPRQPQTSPPQEPSHWFG